MFAAFQRYIGIDYSGAKTPDCSLKGLRIYQASQTGDAVEVMPPAGSKKYWTRRGLAHWLLDLLSDGVPTLVGIDHSFSFPQHYFETHKIEPVWDLFLEDFCQHWPTDCENMYVDFVREGIHGHGGLRHGNSRWRRLCEERAGAKSVFHFDVPGSVAKSTHAGLPWLLFLRRKLGKKVHFWPFDGWDLPLGRSTIVEAYPSLWSKEYSRDERTPDQHDAYVVASWLQQTDQTGKLRDFLYPHLRFGDYAVVRYEGWIMGIR